MNFSPTFWGSRFLVRSRKVRPLNHDNVCKVLKRYGNYLKSFILRRSCLTPNRINVIPLIKLIGKNLESLCIQLEEYEIKGLFITLQNFPNLKNLTYNTEDGVEITDMDLKYLSKCKKYLKNG